MQKEIFIIHGLPSEDYKDFKDRIFRLSEKILKQLVPEKLKICLTLVKPPRISIIPFKRNKVAAISVHRERGSLPDCLVNAAGYTGAYAVEEAIPVSYSRNWKDGETTPGACLLTLFHRKPGLDEPAFIRRWHEGHTSLSLRLHPLWNYNRNVVLETLSENSPWYDGIVDEQVRNTSDLLNPLRFFGPPLKVPLHMLQVYLDTRSFIDMKRIETYLAAEIHLKS
jgi:hypothetical protein